jgi:hypothetical protein
MPLEPYLPILEGESLVSWTSRLARYQTGFGPAFFLRLMGIGRQDVIGATPLGLDRLSALSGVPRADLEKGAYLPLEKRCYVYGGHRFHAQFVGRNRTTYCPACLLETVPNGPCGSHRVGRVMWFFSPVRTCPVHGHPLVRRPNTTYGEALQDMMTVAPPDAELRRIVERSDQRAVSPLQTYVEDRLRGVAGPAWLDGQQIDYAVRATEMLGACQLFGTRADLNELTEDDWDAAGAAGFEATARGPEGIHEVLKEILETYRKASSVRAQPQAVFGRLYMWLQFKRNRKPRGPIEDVVREFILDNMVVEQGTRLFGQSVTAPRFHSVSTLARQCPMDPRTLNRALVRAGHIPGGNEDEIDPHAQFDAEKGRALANRIRYSIAMKWVPRHLNCHRTQAEALLKHGLINRILPGDACASGVLAGIPRPELDDFLARLRTRGIDVEAPGTGMVNMIEAAELCRWPTIDIVKLVLAGGLDRVELLDRDFGFKSVLVDPAEVRNVLVARQAGERLSVDEAARRIGVPTWGVSQLLKLTDDAGRPVLQSHTEANSTGTERHYFDVQEVDFFLSNHVKLSELAAERGEPTNSLSQKLAAKGVAPLLPKTKLNCLIYRRSDVEEDPFES